MTTFAETLITYSDGQNNTEPPPESIMMNGWEPKQQGKRGMPLAANWLNWLFRDVFRKINRDFLTDGNGINAIKMNDCFITVSAIVKGDPTKYLHAIGYKVGSGVPVFKVLSNATLALGSVTANNIPITGATASTIAVQITAREA